jgi:hypothetical protein
MTALTDLDAGATVYESGFSPTGARVWRGTPAVSP